MFVAVLTEDLLDVGPSGVTPTRHEGRSVPRALLATRHTRANKEEAFGLELMCAANRVRVVGVSTVDDDVSLLEVRFELADEIIDSPPGLDEKDDPTGLLQFGAELLDRVGANDVGPCASQLFSGFSTEIEASITLGLVFQESVDFGCRTV